MPTNGGLIGKENLPLQTGRTKVTEITSSGNFTISPNNTTATADAVLVVAGGGGGQNNGGNGGAGAGGAAGAGAGVGVRTLNAEASPGNKLTASIANSAPWVAESKAASERERLSANCGNGASGAAVRYREKAVPFCSSARSSTELIELLGSAKGIDEPS